MFLSAWSWPADSTMNSPKPSRRPAKERWKLMSVTLVSGIIATFLVSTPDVSRIRCEVTTKKSTAQLMTFQIMRPNSTSHAIHTTVTSTWLLCRTVAVSTPAASSPASARTLGPIRTAGCRRTVMTCCSFGRRYRLTAAGPVAPRAGSLMSSKGVHEFSQRASGRVEPVVRVMNYICRAGCVGGEVVHDEDDDRPRYDLLQHPDHLPALSVQAMRRGTVMTVVPSIAQGNRPANG